MIFILLKKMMSYPLIIFHPKARNGESLDAMFSGQYTKAARFWIDSKKFLSAFVKSYPVLLFPTVIDSTGWLPLFFPFVAGNFQANFPEELP